MYIYYMMRGCVVKRVQHKTTDNTEHYYTLAQHLQDSGAAVELTAH